MFVDPEACRLSGNEFLPEAVVVRDLCVLGSLEIFDGGALAPRG
jgi:hypothetical protein